MASSLARAAAACGRGGAATPAAGPRYSSALSSPPAPVATRRPRALAQCARATYCPAHPIRRLGRRSSTHVGAAAAEPSSLPPPSSSSAGADGNSEVAGGGSGTRLTPADLDALAKRKAGRPTSAVGRVGEALSSISLVIVGPSTDLNEAVSRALGKRLGWFPVATRRVLLGLHKAADVDELGARLLRDNAASCSAPAAPDADDLVGAAEAEVLRGLSSQFRCCVATLGGSASAVGAAARGDAAARQDALRRQLAGSLVLWVEEIDKRASTAGNNNNNNGGGGSKRAGTGATLAIERATAEQRPYAALAEVRVALEVATGGFGAASNLSAEQKAEKAASQIVATLGKVLDQDEDVGQRKRAYVEEVLIGRDKLAAAAEVRAEGLERAQAAMEEAQRRKAEEEGAGADQGSN